MKKMTLSTRLNREEKGEYLYEYLRQNGIFVGGALIIEGAREVEMSIFNYQSSTVILREYDEGFYRLFVGSGSDLKNEEILRDLKSRVNSCGRD